ncbi:HD domain-containing protein [Gaiella sp.]|uniref:CCA tRNA nucleotidyltransferase n=1 Tax=Gaiella sp. TaxID=2663207 RepID=UPI00326604CB
MPSEIRSYIRSLGIDAYVVGGAVRDELLGLPHHDEDFVVPRVDQFELRSFLEPHGRVEDMDVHGQLVGVRFYPNDRAIRALAPAGIELTPPRAERSTGPGHQDFSIVSDPSITLDEDMARRDFTINAMARRLADDTLLDPFDGQTDLARRTIRTVTPTSFVEDPLRLVRALRFVSQLGFDVEGETRAQMHASASGLAHVSAERIGGGIKADGMGELSKLLLGPAPRKALLLARDTGVLAQIIPEFVPTIGYSLHSTRQPLPLEEHIFAVVQNAADAGSGLEVRLACLLHDLGKVEADARNESHALLGAQIALVVLARLRYPTDVQRRVARIVAGHAFKLDGTIDELRARRFLAEHGEAIAIDVIAHKHADLNAKPVSAPEHEALTKLACLVEQERSQPHRIGDLVVTGDDLLSIGFVEGPPLGRTLALLLDAVITDPSRNDRQWLLDRAREEAR